MSDIVYLNPIATGDILGGLNITGKVIIISAWYDRIINMYLHTAAFILTYHQGIIVQAGGTALAK